MSRLAGVYEVKGVSAGSSDLTGGTGNAGFAKSKLNQTKADPTPKVDSLEGVAEPMYSAAHSMSTQNFIDLHNMAISQANEARFPDIELKKLIKMMLAVSLLRAVDER